VNLVGGLLLELDRPDEGLATLTRAMGLAPDDPFILNNLGNARLRRGDAMGAVEVLARALEKKPDLVPALANIGNAFRALGHHAKAMEAFGQALAVDPDNIDARNNLAVSLKESGDLPSAVVQYKRALEKAPDNVLLWNNLGSALQDAADLPGAAYAFREAMRLDPANPAIQTNLIFTLDFDPALSMAEIQAERRRWWENHGTKVAPKAIAHANSRDPARKLRVGYVTAYFRWHSSSQAFAAAVLGADPARIEIVCYSDTDAADDLTARFKAKAALWRDIRGLPDAAVAEQIRADAVDILVDCSGHMSGNRLLVFCRKPAPVQVTAWGQANGTGIPLIDAILTDPIILPAEERRHLAEKAVDLPCALSYMVPDGMPEVAPVPALAFGVVTFASFNRLSKLNDETFDLWAEILRRVEGARLAFKARYIADRANVERICGAFQGRGINPTRLLFAKDSPRLEHLAAFAEVDIALDPTPQGGGVSTLDAILMGVPVVTVHGRTVNGRGATSINAVLGLTADCTAETKPEYVEKAVRLASDLDRLAMLRSTLRPRLKVSPIGDPALYAAAIETAYRGLWKDWCRAAPSA
ncbi:MAG: tetratricopeptide repeat protein, partial [Alphaproteobacteria bacterium]|nr:tetratricopeptide repeat protein [Alphaproteobacteria bacterium]